MEKQPLWLARFKHLLGLDRTIAFTILARGWSTLAGLVTVLLIARYLSAVEQGYYYTFSSLVALQVVFELGFSFVILQLATHERAVLQINDDGSISGDCVAHSRLASVVQKAVRWYSIGAALMAAALLPAGYYFFNLHHQSGVQVHWALPWFAAIVSAVFTFQMDPLFSFIEGCGRIPQVACMRLTQAIAGSTLAWISLYLHHGLFAPALIISGQAITGGAFLYTQRGLLIPLLRYPVLDHAVSWKTEIWPFQWRIATSWLCGYFIIQFINPVLFIFRGPVEAGRMGMSLTIATALSAVAIAWINTKASPFGLLIARRDYVTLDRLFFRTLWQSSCLLLSAVLFLLTAMALFGGTVPHLIGRVLPLSSFAILLATVLCNHILFSEAIYLRSHKLEPFMKMSVIVGLLTAVSTILTSKYCGMQGVVLGYFCINGIFGLAIGTTIFQKKRREWHCNANYQEPSA